MDRRKKAILISVAAVVAVAVLIVVLGFFTNKNVSQAAKEISPGISENTQLSDGDKAKIKDLTSQFISQMGNFGWYPSTIQNPTGITAETANTFFANQDHSTAADAQQHLRVLTNSTNFDSSINQGIFTNPFSVETTPTEDISVPNKPEVDGASVSVKVTVPVQSTVSFISTSMAYINPDGSTSPSVVQIQKRTFAGNLNLSFQKSSGDWVVSSFSDTTGVFVVDDFSITNGDLITNSVPISKESLVVN